MANAPPSTKQRENNQQTDVHTQIAKYGAIPISTYISQGDRPLLLEPHHLTLLLIQL
jgi:hypothetical protein